MHFDPKPPSGDCAPRTRATRSRPPRLGEDQPPAGPSQAHLRRAASTAYYAVFHCLAATVADTLMGKGRNEAWHQAYRALEHASAKKACRNMQALRAFPPEVQDFAETFVALQDSRHQADYALDVRYHKSDVLAGIDAAETAIAWLESADIRHRRRFAAHVLFKRRP